jgi:Fe2+ or Zn2+ uptake regulation protein
MRETETARRCVTGDTLLTESRIGVTVESVPTDAKEVLRNHDLQVTAQRLAVMRAVADRAHATAVDVVEIVSDGIGSISRQSVYDTLTLLTERGILRRIQPAGSAALYETRTGDNHHHLVCRSCDRVVDTDCATGETPCLIPVDDGDFEVDEAEVIYWGLCPDCRVDKPPARSARPTRTTN